VYPPNESDPSVTKITTTGADSVPAAPTIISPANDAVISNSLRPALSVQNSVSVRDPLTYTFAVAHDSAFLNLLAYVANISEGEDVTNYEPESNLENYERYYWRARSNDEIFDSPWSETGTFYIGVPVDVKLALFTGKATKGSIELNWETASESGNAGFNIYRSRFQDSGFEKINAKLIPSSDNQQYEYKDRNVGSGTSYYYKLESVNILGVTEQYEVLQVTALIPKEFVLYQNYPNPFNPYTKIEYDMPKATNVTLKIYNVLGQEIKTLINDEQQPGNYQIIWDGTNNYNIRVSSGVYIYQIRAGSFVQAKKMILLR